MKNVTVSLDDETYRRARVKAAEAGRSLSSIVREHLQKMGQAESAEEERRRRLHEFFARMDAENRGISGERISREDLYDEMLGRRDP